MSSPTHHASRPILASLTGLRFVAAMAVVLYHVTLPPGTPSAIVLIASRGYLGVSLFFVLSGFILTYTYIDPADGSLRGSAREFWWARVARIYPTYLAALLFSLPIFALFRIGLAASGERVGTLLSAMLTPLLLQAWWPNAATQWNTPGWSLSVEVFFYALFPLAAVWLARRRNATRIGLFVWVACLIPPLIYLWAAPAGAGRSSRFDGYFWLQAVKFNPAAHLGEFALGVVAGLTFLRGARTSVVSRPVVARGVAVGLACILTIVVATDWLPYALCHNGLLAPLWAALILGLATGRGAVAQLLGARPVVRLGEASYALYLIHSPLIGYRQLLRRLLKIRHLDPTVPSWVAFTAFVLVAIALAFFLHRFVEEPARRAIRAWRSKRRPSSARVPERSRPPSRRASGSNAVVDVSGTS